MIAAPHKKPVKSDSAKIYSANPSSKNKDISKQVPKKKL
jgi:hypothetical protein